MIKNLYIPKFRTATVDNFTSDLGIVLRRGISPIVRKAGKKLIESDKRNPREIHVENYPNLHPTEPYVFASTHSFPDDITTALCTIDRNAYLLTNSVDQLNYNKDMYLLWLNGMIFVDTRDKESRKSSIPKSIRVLNAGTSLLIYPEGSWNVSENQVVKGVFSGPVIIAQESGRKLVPVGSFHEPDSKNIYINYGEPVDLSGYSVDEGRIIVRELLAGLRYELLEKYGSHVKRDDLPKNPRKVWLEEKRKEVFQLEWMNPDWEDEFRTYKDRSIITPEEVWGNIKLTPANAKYIAKIQSELRQEEEFDLVKQLTKSWNK